MNYSKEFGKLKVQVGANISKVDNVVTDLNPTLDGGDVSTKIETIKVLMPNLPTSNPSVAGQLWNDSGTLKISAG